MPLTCPVCRAVNEQGPACRRCKADLSMLFMLEAQRGVQLGVASLTLRAGRLDAAQRMAERAGAIRRGADIYQLLAVAHLLRRDFAAAWKAYRQARSMASEGAS